MAPEPRTSFATRVFQRATQIRLFSFRALDIDPLDVENKRVLGNFCHLPYLEGGANIATISATPSEEKRKASHPGDRSRRGEVYVSFFETT